MPRKRKAFVHIGLDDGAGDFVDSALDRHSRALLELGVRRPAESAEEVLRTAVEILQTHAEWGYKRREVEGTWAAIVRRGLKGRDTLVFSQPQLAAARPEQAALLVAALRDFEVHVVVTVQAPDAWTVPGEPSHDLAAVLDRWSGAVSAPERIHVIIGDDRRRTWKALGRVVGFGTSSLSLDGLDTPARARAPHGALATRGPVLQSLARSWVELLATTEHDVVGDPEALVPDFTGVAPAASVVAAAEHALNEALAEIGRLTRRNASLERRLEATEKKRKKLKKLKKRLRAEPTV